MHRFVGHHRGTVHTRLGGNQDEAQLSAEALQLIMQFTAAIQLHLRIQSRTDAARDPQVFQFLAHEFPHGNDLLPKRQAGVRLFGRGIHGREVIPGLQKHRITALAGDIFPDLLSGEA